VPLNPFDPSYIPQATSSTAQPTSNKQWPQSKPQLHWLTSANPAYGVRFHESMSSSSSSTTNTKRHPSQTTSRTKKTHITKTNNLLLPTPNSRRSLHNLQPHLLEHRRPQRIPLQNPHAPSRQQRLPRLLRPSSHDLPARHRPRRRLRARPARPAHAPSPPNPSLARPGGRPAAQRQHAGADQHVGAGRHGHVPGRLLWDPDGRDGYWVSV
jgi:hypothetical protein